MDPDLIHLKPTTLPPELVDEILEWTARLYSKRRLDLLTLCRRVHPRIQSVLLERVIFKIIKYCKPCEYGPDRDLMNTIFDGFLNLIDAQLHLAAHVREIYITSLSGNRDNLSTLFTHCPNLRHLSLHVELAYYSPPTDESLFPLAVGTSPPDKCADLSGLLNQHSLSSLCVSLETFRALMCESDASSPWTRSITHIEVQVQDTAGFNDIYAGAVPSVALLCNLTHFAIIHDSYVSKRQVASTLDSIPVVLSSAPSLGLLVILDDRKKFKKLAKKDPRVVVMHRKNAKASSQTPDGWEAQIVLSKNSLWSEAEKRLLKHERKYTG